MHAPKDVKLSKTIHGCFMQRALISKPTFRIADLTPAGVERQRQPPQHLTGCPAEGCRHSYSPESSRRRFSSSSL